MGWSLNDEIYCTMATCRAKGSKGRFGTVCRNCGTEFGHTLPKKVKRALRKALKQDGVMPHDYGNDCPPLDDMIDMHEARIRPDPPKPVELPPEVLRQVMHYGPVFAGEPFVLTKPIGYVMTKRGIMEVRRTKIGTTARYVTAVPGLQEMAEGMTLAVPLIPWEIVRQTVAFFRDVSRRRGSCEAFVQYWYDPTLHVYSVFVPKQEVGGAHVHVKPEDNYPPMADQLIHVADCHSHGSDMGAFFSGTDDQDELAKGDRIYMVIGRVLDDAPQIKIRAVAGNGFLAVDPSLIIEAPRVTALKLTGHGSAQDKGEDRGTGKGSTQIGYAADPFAEASFPSVWMDALIDEKPTIITHFGSIDSRLPEHYRTRDTMLLHHVDDIIFGGRKGLPRKTQNAPFLPGTAFEDYDTHDGGTIRVYANGVIEDITVAIKEQGHVFIGD